MEQGRAILSWAVGLCQFMPESSPELGGDVGMGAMGGAVTVVSALEVGGMGGALHIWKWAGEERSERSQDFLHAGSAPMF